MVLGALRRPRNLFEVSFPEGDDQGLFSKIDNRCQVAFADRARLRRIQTDEAKRVEEVSFDGRPLQLKQQ